MMMSFSLRGVSNQTLNSGLAGLKMLVMVFGAVELGSVAGA